MTPTLTPVLTGALTVTLHGQPIGELTPRRNGAQFCFLPHVVERHHGLPLLSAALPVRQDAYDAALTRNWFTGLLPEDRQRSEVERRFGLQGEGYLELLRQIGWECAGAVAMIDEATEQGPGGTIPLDTGELAQRLRALPTRPFDPDAALRHSLGGYQEKLLVVADPSTSSGFALPTGGTISTHLLKPQPADRYPGLIEGEAWAMRVAEHGTHTAHTELLDLPEGPLTLVVTRFDREIRDGVLRRLHQEDAAQAMGLAPERKYASSGSPRTSDPTLGRIARIVERFSNDPPAEWDRLFAQVIVNVALGNTDAHAKNYGLLHPDPHTVTLSPLYDVNPDREINPGVVEMGLRVANRLRIDRIGRTQLVEEASSWGLREQRAESVLDRVLDSLVAGIDQADADYPHAAARHSAPALARIKGLREDG